MTDQEITETANSFKSKLVSFLKTSWGRFLLGVLIIFLTGKTCSWFATHDHLVIASFLGVIVGIVGILPVMALTWRAGPMILTLFIFIFAGMIPCFTTKYGGNGDTVSGIMVADAPKYPSETVFYFLDGKVMKDYLGYEPIMGRRYKVGDAYVAPIVPDDWKPTDPVPAWAYAEYNSPDAWDQELRAGIREAYDGIKEEAVKDAEESYRIKSAENAPILMWIDNPERELQLYKGINRILLIVFVVIFTLVFWLGEYLPAKEKEISKKRKNKSTA